MIASFAELRQLIGLEKRLLVLVPHPDDETLGCGGLLALSGAAGIEVTILLVTDGGASHPASTEWPRHRLVAQRKIELSRALQALGIVGDPISLDLPDGGTESLPSEQVREAIDRVAAVVRAKQPDIVLTTWRREPHCDHRFAFRLAQEAIAVAQSHAALVEYMVWTPLTGALEDQPRQSESRSFLLDCTEARKTKLAALQCHESQLGKLIADDPQGFRLTARHIETMTGRYERYEHAR